MPRFATTLFRRGREQRFGLDDWLKAKAGAFTFGGSTYPYPVLGVPSRDAESIEHDYRGYIYGAFKSSAVVFAVMLARLLLFTEARFVFQRLERGRPTELFGTQELAILENPWPGGTTGDLLARMEQDVSLSGNFYAVRTGDRLRRLRPDWVQIILTAPPEEAVTVDIAGYAYAPGGNFNDQTRVRVYAPDEVVHWAPIPDPDAMYRGMSWLTPVIREVMADKAATEHKARFFANAATPTFAVTFGEHVDEAQFREFVEEFRRQHTGTENAYKTLFLAGGADITVLGSDLKQLDFKLTQGAGETRIAAAGGVPPIIVGLSEGLASATYSNYGMARRKFGDHWARPMWRSAAAALSQVVNVPPGARLWYDDRDISFLREDLGDAAQIMATRSGAIRTLVDAGFTADSAVAAVEGDDLTLLQHSGLFSVQLQQPGTSAATDDRDDDQAESAEG